MGGAQPLAITMNEGACLAIEVDPARAERRHEAGYVDEMTARPGRGDRNGRRAGAPPARRAVHRADRQCRRRRAGAGAPRLAPGPRHGPDLRPRPAERVRAGRHRPGGGAARCASATPTDYTRRSMASMAEHVRAMLAFQASGSVVFDYGNNIRAARQGGRRGERLRLPRLRAGLHPAALLRGQGSLPLGRPVRRPGRHPARPMRPWPSSSPRTPACTDGCAWPRRRCRSRACRPGSAGWATGSGRGPGCGSTRWWRQARYRAPIVIGRDHLDAGSVASPYRETEGDARRIGCDRRLADPQRPRSTRPPAPPGSASITAAASGSAIRCMPGW